MQNLEFRLYNGFLGVLNTAPFVGGISALGGFVYAKFKDLPSQKVALAFAIWHITESFFVTMAATLSENETTKASLRIAVLITSCIVGTHELQKRGFLGSKLMICLNAIKAIAISANIVKAFTNECKDDLSKVDDIYI